tara:strand:+ start:6903 stop:8177 length:1275 start_codon:yes stop_codon:yes gene_type:complete
LTHTSDTTVYHSRLIYPFQGLRPQTESVDEVAAPPYDVLSSSEARLLAHDKPLSFLHISKPEIDLPEGTDPFSNAVYEKGAENICSMLESGVLVKDKNSCYYIYRLETENHRQTGLVGVAPISAYDENRIRKHEFTRPDKETDRVKQIDYVNAQTGPVLLVHRPSEPISMILHEITMGPSLYEVELSDGVKHSLWLVEDSAVKSRIDTAYEDLDCLYIADGHHRSAAASRVCDIRRSANPNHNGSEAYNRFLIVAFPSNELQILDYNRIVLDLNNLSSDNFLDRLNKDFEVIHSDHPVKPNCREVFGMYLEKNWYKLKLRVSPRREISIIEQLDVRILSDRILEPILGVGDLRTDPRINFVGGVRGLEELELSVDSGKWEVAFSLFPTEIEDLMTVADIGEVMPPKSTWFEPKLADGLVSYPIE